VWRNRTKPGQDLELPFYEVFQVGNSDQSNQRLPRDDSRHRYLGQEHCHTEREDHSEQDEPGGQGLCEGPQGVDETLQRGFSEN
jgi:hypothetical protein